MKNPREIQKTKQPVHGNHSAKIANKPGLSPLETILEDSPALQALRANHEETYKSALKNPNVPLIEFLLDTAKEYMCAHWNNYAHDKATEGLSSALEKRPVAPSKSREKKAGQAFADRLDAANKKTPKETKLGTAIKALNKEVEETIDKLCDEGKTPEFAPVYKRPKNPGVTGLLTS